MVETLAKPSLNPPSSSTTTVTLDVQGMKCAGCVAAVERQLNKQTGVTSACVNLITQVAVVTYEDNQIKPESIAQKLTDTGFPSSLRSQEANFTAESRQKSLERWQQERKSQGKTLWIAIILLIFSSLGHLNHITEVNLPFIQDIRFHFVLATLALLFPGRQLILDGAKALRQGMPNMNTLVGLGTVSAYLASCIALFWPQLGWQCFFDEPVMLLGFIFLGRTLEGQARHKAASALETLMTMQPQMAQLMGKESDFSQEGIEIPVEQIKIGEWVRVLPGEKIPVDGDLVKGQTTVDESLVTGESYPVLKKEGEGVMGGTLNLSGAILVKTTKIGKNTALSQIIASVEAAQTRKAPIQKWVDQIAGYFSYGVMTIALITFLFWQFVGTRLFPDVLQLGMTHHTETTLNTPNSPLLLSLKLAIAVLVVSCPCALGLATPTAILVGTGIGAERGLLIKGGDVLEKVAHLKTIFLDKTGTITQGCPIVTQYIPLSNITADSLLQIAASVEQGTIHPLGQAIQRAAKQKHFPLLSAQNFHTEVGLGVSADIEGERFFLGNEAGLEYHQISLDAIADHPLRQTDQTLVYLANQREVKGIIALKDKLRLDTQSTLKKLKKMGIELVLLSGDQKKVVAEIAKELEILPFFAQIRPDEKAKIIQQFQKEAPSNRVAMVGDGINDAPALAQADIGISLQNSSQLAIETADIVLINGNLSDLVTVIKLSQATFNKIRQNLFWALGYNLIAIPIAAGLLLPSLGWMMSPSLAAGLMAMSSVTVVTNALFLRHEFAQEKTVKMK